MNIMLPFADPAECARVLSPKALNSQINEAMLCLKIIIGTVNEKSGLPYGVSRKKDGTTYRNGYGNNPCVKLYRDYGYWLHSHYTNELLCRFMRNSDNRVRHAMELQWWTSPVLNEPYGSPPWLGHEPLHSAYRAHLLSKDPGHYGQFGWAEEPKKYTAPELCEIARGVG